VRELEAALWASQHPTGHVSALGSRVLGLMTLVGERTRRERENVEWLWGARGRRRKKRKKERCASYMRSKRDSSLRQPTRSQEANAKKMRRLTPLGMTVEVGGVRKREHLQPAGAVRDSSSLRLTRSGEANAEKRRRLTPVGITVAVRGVRKRKSGVRLRRRGDLGQVRSKPAPF
jgi:hypothetical protein